MEQANIDTVEKLFIRNSGFLLAILGAESRRKFTEAVEQLNLGWQDQNVITCLHELTKHGAVSQRKLADFAGIDPRNLVPVIDSLEQSGMLRRVPDPADRRGYQMHLTTQGEVMTDKIQEIRTELENDMFISLSPHEKKILHELLKKLWVHSDIPRARMLPSTNHK